MNHQVKSVKRVSGDCREKIFCGCPLEMPFVPRRRNLAFQTVHSSQVQACDCARKQMGSRPETDYRIRQERLVHGGPCSERKERLTGFRPHSSPHSTLFDDVRPVLNLHPKYGPLGCKCLCLTPFLSLSSLEEKDELYLASTMSNK